MDEFLGVLAFVQSTIPILSALPIVLGFRVPLRIRQVVSFHLIILAQLVIIGAVGLVAFLTPVIEAVLSGEYNSIRWAEPAILFALLALNVIATYLIMRWTYQELIAQETIYSSAHVENINGGNKTRKTTRRQPKS